MRTRHALLVLAGLTLCLALLGGYLHYQARLQSARETLHESADRHISYLARQISLQLDDRVKAVRFFSRLPVLPKALLGNVMSLAETNRLLDDVCADQAADVCYLMGENGGTVASSNRNSPTSFVGQDYSFRPYFRQAMTGVPSVYLALGVTSQKRGIYCSHPVYREGEGGGGTAPAGVVVIKYGLGQIEDFFFQFTDGFVFLVDPSGVIFAGNRDSYLYKTLWREGENGGRRIGDERQFGAGPREWAGFVRDDGSLVEDEATGKRYILHQAGLGQPKGWQVVYLHDLQLVNEQLHAAFFQMGGMAVVLFLLVTTVVVFLLSRRIDREVLLRIRAEEETRRLNEDLEEKVRERTTELAATREELLRSEKLAVLGQLAGSIAHDLRNPLGAISNATELLRLPGASEKSAPDRLLAIIEEQIRRCADIINGLLEFARSARLEIGPCAMRDVIREALTRTRIPKEVSVSLDIPASLPAVPLDLSRMQQVFVNLLTNAVQAMPAGGRLSIDVRTDGDSCRVAIRDTGVGIPPENLGKVFKPLFSTRTKGFGLGLATVKQIVEAHGGRIEVASEPGKGTCFTLHLPLTPSIVPA